MTALFQIVEEKQTSLLLQFNKLIQRSLKSVGVFPLTSTSFRFGQQFEKYSGILLDENICINESLIISSEALWISNCRESSDKR